MPGVPGWHDGEDAARWPGGDSAPEPAGASARAEIVLLGDEGSGRLTEGAGRLWSREEVDVHAADPPATELDVTGTQTPISARLLAAPKGREQGGGDNTRRPLRENARLRHADRGDVPDRIGASALSKWLRQTRW
jgi:hypothetical protein